MDEKKVEVKTPATSAARKKAVPVKSRKPAVIKPTAAVVPRVAKNTAIEKKPIEIQKDLLSKANADDQKKEKNELKKLAKKEKQKLKKLIAKEITKQKAKAKKAKKNKAKKAKLKSKLKAKKAATKAKKNKKKKKSKK